jgi:hypothetical protein
MAKPYNPHILTKAERQKGGNKLQKLLKKNKALNKKRIQAINQAYKNPKYKKKLSKAQKSRFQSKKARKKMSITLKRYFAKKKK